MLGGLLLKGVGIGWGQKVGLWLTEHSGVAGLDDP